MAFFRIPLDNDVPAYTFNVDLEESDYSFTFRYNTRIDQWVFDIYDQDQNPIQLGNPLIVNYPALRQNVRENKYPGGLVALNENVSNADPTRFNVGVDVDLFYDESEDAS